MSWGRSPSQGLGALGRSPFKSSTPRPFAPSESSSSSSSSGGSSRDLSSGGGGGGGGTNGQGSEWTLLDERVSRGPASCSPGMSASREFLMMAKHRRRSMSLDIPQHQHQNQQQHHNNYHHGQHHQPLPPHHHQQQHQRSSSGAFSCSPGGNFPSSLSREFSGLSTGTGGTTTSATSNHSFRDRSSSSGAGSTLDGSGIGSASASGSTAGSVGGSGSGALRSGAASSSSFSSVASASETSTAMGATGAGGSESNLQRQIRARLEEAEQQTAYWQARAKEAEQAALKSKTECVTLRCQLNAQQCTASSVDEVLVSMHSRLERIREGLEAKGSGDGPTVAAVTAGSGDGRRRGGGGGGGGGDRYHSRPSVLENIELGLMALEEQLVEGGPVRGGREGGGRGARASAKDACTMTNLAAAAAASALAPSSPPTLPASVIHFRRFSPGDVALFFPTPAGDYLAFNVGCPHHYLSEDSKALIGKDKHFRKYYVLGRITRLMKCQVPSVEDVEDVEEGGREGGRGVAGGVSKGPYDLAGGCRYAVVSVEPIKSL